MEVLTQRPSAGCPPPAPVRGHPVYVAQEVELEAPEPAPHCSIADEPPDQHTGAGSNGHHGHHKGVADGGNGAYSTAHSLGAHPLGIMRTSPQPPPSHLHAQRVAAAAAFAATHKTRGKRVDKQAAVGFVSGVPALPPSPVIPLSSLSYASAVRRSGTSSDSSPSPADPTSPALLEYAHDLPPERDTGNVEYKLKLLHKSSDRLVHLTTQLAYRLSEGGGEMLYELGVQDDGYAQGLSVEELEESIRCVERMAQSLHAEAMVITRAWGKEGRVAEVRVRYVGAMDMDVDRGTEASASSDSAAEEDFKRSTAHERMAAPNNGQRPETGTVASFAASSTAAAPSIVFGGTPCPCLSSPAPSTPPSCPSRRCDLRLALVGGSHSGKSSLLGHLVSNERDDGRGRARLHVVRHRHEVERGRSSAIARQVIGFDLSGRVVNYSVHHTQTLGGRSAAPMPIPVPSTSSLRGRPLVKKVDKGLSGLFGGSDEEDSSSGDDDEDDEELSSPSSEAGSAVDFGFGFQAQAVSSSPDPLVGSEQPPQVHPLSSFASMGGGGGGGSTDGCTHSACSSGNDWPRVWERSHKVYTLFDMPGHADSSRTTVYGLIGTSCPDYCCIVVECKNTPTFSNVAAAQAHQTAPSSSDSSVTTAVSTATSSSSVATGVAPAAAAPTPLISSLTREQILICASLRIPFLLLVCKSDLASPSARARIVRALEDLCAQVDVQPAGGDMRGAAPSHARVVRHKVPLLLTPPSPGETNQTSAAAAAAATAELEACLELLERNQMGGVAEEDIPMVIRPMVIRALTRARSGGGGGAVAPAPSSSSSSSSSSVSSCCGPLYFPQHSFVPLLLLSNVSGEGMELFLRVLHRLHNYRASEWERKMRRPARVHQSLPAGTGDQATTAAAAPLTANLTLASPLPAPPPAARWEPVGVEFSIDDLFTVDGIGSVVSGTILSGVIHEGDSLLLGPLPSVDVGVPLPPVPAHWPAWTRAAGVAFRPVLVKSLHVSRKSFKNARAGQSATLALKRVDRALLRRGMVLLTIPEGYGLAGVPRGIGAPVAATPTLPGRVPTAPQPQRSAWLRACVGFEAYVRLFDPIAPSTGSSSSSGRALREARTSGGSRSGTGLSHQHRRAAAGGASSLLHSPPSASPLGSPPSRSPTHAPLRGHPIIHVGNLRQCGEVVSFRPVSLRTPRSHHAVEEWFRAQEALVASRDQDETHGTEEGLEALLDKLEGEEAEEATSTATAAAVSVPLVAPALPPSSNQPHAYALVRFEFLYQSEFLRLGRSVLFRDERTRATGRISNIYAVEEEEEEEAEEHAEEGGVGSPERHLRPQSSDSTSTSISQSPSPGSASSGGSRGLGRKHRLSSPPLPSKSTSPPAPAVAVPVVLSAFQRTKESRARKRRVEEEAAEATMAAAARAALQGSAAAHATTATATATSGAALPHSHSQSSLPAPSRPRPHAHPHSQRASLSRPTLSPLLSPRRRPVAPCSVSLGCTPMLSSSSSSSAAAPMAGRLAEDPLQLESAAVTE